MNIQYPQLKVKEAFLRANEFFNKNGHLRPNLDYSRGVIRAIATITSAKGDKTWVVGCVHEQTDGIPYGTMESWVNLDLHQQRHMALKQIRHGGLVIPKTAATALRKDLMAFLDAVNLLQPHTTILLED